MRVLRYHGIQQTDWHLDQILVPKLEGLEFNFVFIDFGFAELRRSRLEGDYVAPFGGAQSLVIQLLENIGDYTFFRVDDDVWFPLDGYEV